jgi:hypothetical protein
MAKKLDFKDFLTVDYAPGMDPLIKKNAKKRKSDETETSGPNEAAIPPGGKAPAPLKTGQVQSYLDTGKHTTRLSGKNAMGWPTKDTKVKLQPKKSGAAGHIHVHQLEDFNQLADLLIDEAVLDPQQRRQKAMQFKRMQAKIQMGQKRAKAKFADPKRLLHRAKRAARTLLLKRLTRGVGKEEMTFQRRQQFDKQLDTPVMKKRIERIAIKMLPKERQLEIQRHKQASAASQ